MHNSYSDSKSKQEEIWPKIGVVLICGLQHSMKAYWLFNLRINKVILSCNVEFNETNIGLNMDKVLAHLGNSLLELSDVDIEELRQSVFPFEQNTMMECGNFN